MKKIFLLFWCFCFSSLTVTAKDFLYVFENTDLDYAKNTVNLYAENKNYSLKKNGNDYYLEGKKGRKWLISFTQSYENIEVYFYTPNKNSKEKKEILKYFKKRNIQTERIKKTSEIQKYREFSGILYEENFSKKQDKNKIKEENSKENSSENSLPSGLKLNLSLTSDVTSESLEKDDRISATVTEDIVSEDKILAEKGSIAYGSAIKAVPAQNGYSSGELVIKFDKILTTQGKELSVKSSQSVHKKTKAEEVAKKAGTIAASVVLGVGAIAMLGPVGVAGWITAAAVGTFCGIGIGVDKISKTKGDEIELTEGQTLLVVTL